jgi:hypothetical protein
MLVLNCKKDVLKLIKQVSGTRHGKIKMLITNISDRLGNMIAKFFNKNEPTWLLVVINSKRIKEGKT